MSPAPLLLLFICISMWTSCSQVSHWRWNGCQCLLEKKKPYCLKSCRKPCLNQRWKKKNMRAHIKVEISDFFQKIENTDNTVPTFLHGNTPLNPTSNCFLRWVLSVLPDFYGPLFSLRLRSMSGSIFFYWDCCSDKSIFFVWTNSKTLKHQSKEQFLLWSRPQT